MKKWITAFAAISMLFIACTKDEIASVLGGNDLTEAEVIAGLKDALKVGTDTSVTILHKVDGYYKDEIVKILLPAEAQVVYDNISKVPGGSDLLERTILAMNRAAEDAATEAKPIFVDAITSITIQDGFNILKGSDTAATSYLKGKTFNPLKEAFSPKIGASLSKPLVLGVSAESAYSNLISAYNTASLNGLLFDKVTTNTLSDHVTTMALNGLFVKVADEEKSIRKDPLARVTDILKKVFGK